MLHTLELRMCVQAMRSLQSAICHALPGLHSVCGISQQWHECHESLHSMFHALAHACSGVELCMAAVLTGLWSPAWLGTDGPGRLTVAVDSINCRRCPGEGAGYLQEPCAHCGMWHGQVLCNLCWPAIVAVTVCLLPQQVA